MENYLKRMLAEYEELKVRLIRLNDFIHNEDYKELDDENRSLLNAQYHTMYTYKVILSRRIKINGGII